MTKPRASRIYESTSIVCSCEGGATSAIEKVQYDHRMGSLFFCPSCQTLKCPECCAHHLESRLCTNCGTDYIDSGTTSVCDKNCFVCPLCSSDLLIHGSNTLDNNGVQGKSFTFKCGFCDYSYVTSVITTPRPLHRILNSERKRNLIHHKLFDTFRLTLTQDPDKSGSYSQIREKDEIRQKLSQLNISHENTKDSSETERYPIDLEQDYAMANERKLSTKQTRNYSADILNQSIYNRPTHNELYPLAASLTLRWSHSCLACHTILDKPSPKDSNKFITKWNAIDFLPAIDFTYPHLYISCGGSPNEFMIHFRNPMGQKVHLNISSTYVVPECYVNKSGFEVQVSFPISKFSVGPNTEATDLIKSIPTALLTKNTVQARVEYQERLTRKQEQGLEVLDNILDSQYNWCLIPLNITCLIKSIQPISDTSNTVHIKLPLYVTMTSKLPEPIKQLTSLKETLNVGYWCFVDLGEYTIQI
ncbi:uncharacterized protein KQ657_003278 [Scheffersomyces spartinae]|uniref:Dynactin subunit 4 n=1 Tax=Scheffersomyces spartinae TaxID=45513 RepID=A0A9P7VCX0_9ASCO|nr:uncharacterized protein KQ657_003278 [Scheffersomyces spartinae]KAG7195515.1 hypothetical protein KQ657_003278 [Scheffersomyces spartinae]